MHWLRHAAAAAVAAPGTCKSRGSNDLELAASLTWSCCPGVSLLALQQYRTTAMPVAGHRPPATRASRSRAWNARCRLLLLCCCNDVCYEVTIHFCTQKIFFPKVYEKRSLVLTQQVTDYGFPIMAILRIGINEAQPKNLNGNAQLCKSGHISFAVFGCWVVFLQILVFLPIIIDGFFYRSCKSKPAQWASI